MTRIVHISDTHFGTEIPAVVAALLSAIHAQNPDVVLLSGDITQRARKDEFAAAAAFMRQCPDVPHLVIPGNHDLPLFNVLSRFVAPYGHYHTAFAEREAVWGNGDVAIVALDATHPLRHTRGRLNAPRLREAVAEARSGLKPHGLLLMAAHQPLVTAWQKDADETLVDAQASAILLSELRVDAALSGHVHVPIVETTHRFFDALVNPFVLAGAGTAVSGRTRKGVANSFNVLVVAPNALTVERHDFDGAAFALAETCVFTRSADGWHNNKTCV